MYLKSLEMIGFKSFAEKTKLEFERGLTCIVGPNGCGKSNIADAIRWVLGEQSAKALRGGKMQDVIFNGTETAKPMGMCEVSLTLTECERTLGTEYNEVTVTRRVLRSGEGQYFINRGPCRLKDIQRLFMDTGIGIDSYSMMEQGKIDRVLSSRPEDRRAVFEEASGITKFKADRKEALRKLDHTEANLLRLDDIVREVRRQIISLQRQAGKARRYQALQATLRDHDVYFTRERLRELDEDIQRIDGQLAALSDQTEAARSDLESRETQVAASREQISDHEVRIGELLEEASDARGRLERCRELIRNNQERIAELEALVERDQRDADDSADRLERLRGNLDGVVGARDQACAERDAAQVDLSREAAALTEVEQETKTAERSLHAGRTELVEMESRSASLQNELSDLDAQERTHLVRRERLAAERAEFEWAVGQFAERLAVMDRRLEALRTQVEERINTSRSLKSDREGLDRTIRAIRQGESDLRSQSAALQARIDVLSRSATDGEGFSGGARALLGTQEIEGIDRSTVVGALADHLRVEEPYRVALEAVLRAWLDAVIVRDESAARELLPRLQALGAGSARLLPASSAGYTAPPPSDGPSARLIDQISVSDELRPLLCRLLAGVCVVDRMDDMPETIPPDQLYVSRDGAIRRSDGITECWMPDEQPHNPLARAQQLGQWRAELEKLARRAEQLGQDGETRAREADALAGRIDVAAAELDEARRALNLAEGEHQVVGQEADQAAQRLDTVTFELEASSQQGSEREGRRNQIVETIGRVRERQAEVRTVMASQTEALRLLEERRSTLREVVTEHRIRFAERRQQAEHLDAQVGSMAAQADDLENRINERRTACRDHTQRIDALRAAVVEAQTSEGPWIQACEEIQERLSRQRAVKQELVAEVEGLENELRTKRNYLEELTGQRSQLDVRLAEQRLRRQTHLDRVASEYGVRYDDVMSHPEPEWEDGVQPDPDALDTLIGELRAKLDSMGPVNLVAIEEHRELEERYAFLTQQQDDLVNAKQQLMDLIRQINKKTTEMFSSTFHQVNDNFQLMFKKLFGGGAAKLVLVDEESVLESGIEIIARPPGKKLQSVSLLSGGERTMTAVALLFSLYLVKPSAFCVLDELDAALDEANIGRFVETVTEFLEQSQFIVITHNRRTIYASDVLYGVTMPDHGVSRVVSVKLSEYARHGVVEPALS